MNYDSLSNLEFFNFVGCLILFFFFEQELQVREIVLESWIDHLFGTNLINFDCSGYRVVVESWIKKGDFII